MIDEQTPALVGNLNAVAKAIGVNSSRCRQLVRAGVLPRHPPREYPIEECVRLYREWIALSDRANPHNAKPDRLPATAGEERRRAVLAQAAQRELQYLQAAGLLVPAAELETLWVRAAASIRERILQASDRIGTKIVPYIQPDKEIEVRGIILDEIESALAAVANEAPR